MGAAVHKVQGKGGTKRRQQKQQKKGSKTQKQRQFRRPVSPAEQNHHIFNSKYQAKNATCFKCGKEGHYSSVCGSVGKNAKANKVQTQPGLCSRVQYTCILQCKCPQPLDCNDQGAESSKLEAPSGHYS